MRTAIAVTALATAVGFGAGWLAHGGPREIVRTVYRTSAVPKSVVATPGEKAFPDYPKPALDTPKPTPSIPSLKSPEPAPLTGDIPRLPTPEGSFTPISPEIPPKLPVVDLNADEALVRRLVVASGGEIVSSADAKDATGKVGRALVAETDQDGLERLRATLRKALGDRAVLSDGGSVRNSSPDVRKAEDALAALRKKRDQARIDYLSESPVLRDLEESYLDQERALSRTRRASSRPRLNVLLRPTLT